MLNKFVLTKKHCVEKMAAKNLNIVVKSHTE